ncbi:hypothetical protein [Okeania sp. SIO2B3]|nr:hypothetical protein [Okeania sp. SIO2B3]NET45858.1 hypothetical protein [Okeania sp. SIO2B3]
MINYQTMDFLTILLPLEKLLISLFLGVSAVKRSLHLRNYKMQVHPF